MVQENTWNLKNVSCMHIVEYKITEVSVSDDRFLDS